MTIGDVIRKYRKNIGMTQEDMANCLGVTAPAVNKWERGNTLPDVALLAPIARLLGITTDELLSFQNELTDEETDRYLLQIQKDLEDKAYHEVFLSARKKIAAYPNCEKLIWQTAVMLDAKRLEAALLNVEYYDLTIFSWYEQCLRSGNEPIRKQAADSLFHAYIRKEDYEKARKYLSYFSLDDPERKRKEALVNSKTGKRGEAYRAYEELILTGYQQIQMTLNDLRILYMEDNDPKMAKKLVTVSSAVASAFEMGKYHEICVGLDIAAWERDVAWTAQLMHEILNGIETIGDFAKSCLYQHMALKAVEPYFTDGLRRELLKLFEDRSFDYMQGNDSWEKLKNRIALCVRN